MFNPSAYENSQPDGFGVLEFAPDPESKQPEPRRFVPLRRTELTGIITGPLAGLRLVQMFRFASEQFDKPIEAVYRFPLPGDAAVTSVRVKFGPVEIRAELKERSKAETEYAEAKQQGRQAALVTRESPDVFTLQVAGIQPGQDVTVETRYVQLARAEGAGWSLRIPLTTSPRYVRSDELTSRHAQGQPLALLRDPGHRFTLDLAIRGAANISSPTHRLDMLQETDRKRVRLKDGEVIPDRDCVLTWQPAQEANRAALQVWLHDDREAGQVYFLALVAPPGTRDPGRGVPREVILLVDHSGSMEGAKWQAADWAVERFCSDLGERDRLALGVFHNVTRWHVGKPTPASARFVEQAIAFLKANRDSGGTELGVALEQAVHLDRTSGEIARNILIVTDAEVTDAGRILRLADDESKRPGRRRISVLCIDAAPNATLATELAERGGGVSRFLTSSPDEEDIATALDEVLADWAEPVLTGLRLEVQRPQVEAAGRETLPGEAGWTGIDLGDLPAGRPIWVAGRVRRGESPELAFRLRAAQQHEVAACRFSLAEAGEFGPALKALFGAGRLRGLEYLMHAVQPIEQLNDSLRHLGYDPSQVLSGTASKGSKVYAENQREDASHLLRSLLVSESVSYGLACGETAFVATRTESGQPVAGTVMVANALPSGWSDTFLLGGGAVGRSGFSMCLASAAPMTMADFGSSEFDLGPSEESEIADVMAAPPAPLPVTSPAMSRVPTRETGPTVGVVFAGVPSLTDGEAILYDSRQDKRVDLPEEATICRLEARFPEGIAAGSEVDGSLCLLIYVDDLATPRARVRLIDLIRQRGERPLNILKRADQLLRLVLIGRPDAWKADARLEVSFAWQE
jgi:Ca-activated chloride channel homolog